MVSPSTALSVVGALTFGTFCTCCVEAASRGMDMLLNAQPTGLSVVGDLAFRAFYTSYVEAPSKRMDILLNAHPYRVRPRFNPEPTVENANQAFERFKKNHNVAYKYYLKYSGLSTNETEKEHVFRQRTLEWLKEGNCFGQTSHLLQIIKETNGSLNPKIIAKMDAEDVFYRQHRHEMKVTLRACFETIKVVPEFNKSINLKAQIKETKHNLVQQIYPYSKQTNFDKESYIQKKLEKLKKESKNLKKLDCLASVSKSPNFLAASSVEDYAEILEKTISTSPTKDPVVGALKMYQHVFAFQYSSEGYYIYDCFSAKTGGLFKYPDRETFFQKLREQALSDLNAIEAHGKRDISFRVLNLSQ